MIANLWSYLDLLQQHITTLAPGFDVFAWKPIAEQNDTNWYFSLVSNDSFIGDDSTWTHIKEALIDFTIISWVKSTPQVELYEKLDTLSNLLVTEAGERITLPGSTFIIYSIQEWIQSWVLYDVNENPYLMAQYKVIYQYRYNSDPRI